MINDSLIYHFDSEPNCQVFLNPVLDLPVAEQPKYRMTANKMCKRRQVQVNYQPAVNYRNV